MSIDIEVRCAALLRELRRKKGFTLQECEERSGGSLKAVVLGSYERGHRAISLARLQQLANFYEVPVEYFFAPPLTENPDMTGRLIFDIRRIRALNNLEPALESVRRYLTSIASRRRDWNCEVISLRGSDREILALVNGVTVENLLQELRLAGFLFTARN